MKGIEVLFMTQPLVRSRTWNVVMPTSCATGWLWFTLSAAF